MRTTTRRVGAGRPVRSAFAAIATLALLAGGLTATAAPAAAAAAGVTDGLVLWYKLDQSAGSVATDSSGNGHDGTVLGAAGWSGDQGLAFNIGAGTAGFTGTGTVNGAGRYRFRISVTDYGTDARRLDRIGITIWDAHTGKVVYDLAGGRTVPLAGGGIVVSRSARGQVR